MATTYYTGDTVGNLLKRRGIYRATTGRDLPSGVIQEALQADISARKAAEEAARQFDENKRLQDEQIKAMKDADKAAAIQGAANIGQGLLTGYLGYKTLTKAPSALETAQADYLKSLTQKQTATSATTLTPPSTSLSVTSATAGSAPLLSSPTSFGDPAAALSPGGVQATSTVAPELITDAAIKEAGALAAPGELSAAGATETAAGALAAPGELSAAGATETAAGAGTMGGLLSAAGAAAALYAAQNASAPYVDKVIGKDLPNTSKGWKYGGVAGAQIGFAVDVGKKTVNYAKKLVKKLF